MKPLRLSLTFSILASLACLLGLTWILLSLISYKTAEQNLLSQKSEEGRVLLGSFISILPERFPELREDAKMAKFLANLARERAFSGILIVDREGKPAYSRNDTKGPDQRLLETVKSGGEWSAFARNGMTIMRYAPISANGKIVGAARLSLSLAGEYERLKRSGQMFFAYFVIDFVLLFGLGSYLLSKIVVVPMKRLIAATERVTAGDYTHAVHVPGSAEIAALAESFTVMQDTLRTNREQAESYMRSLERANLDLQAAREESDRSEKMASVGLLAAGMAHEMGTPLSAIIGYTGILRDELQEDPVKADYLRRIENEAGRMDRLLRVLLDFARPTAAHMEHVDVGGLLGDTVDLFTHRDDFNGIVISLDIEKRLPLVHVDRHQLQQVLINLVVNARDSMAGVGRLAIAASRSQFSTHPAPAPYGSATVTMGRRKEDFNSAFAGSAIQHGSAVSCLRIDIHDTGSGITREHAAKIFDPFFTTKEPGKGTGLGLSICSRIIDTFGGRITVASAPGNGATFTLWLPLAETVNPKASWSEH